MITGQFLVFSFYTHIFSDFWKLSRDFGVDAASIIKSSVIELHKYANLVLECKQQWNLNGLLLHLLKHRLNKEKNLRCGSWSRAPLTAEQIQYAATDAYVSIFCIKRKIQNLNHRIRFEQYKTCLGSVHSRILTSYMFGMIRAVKIAYSTNLQPWIARTSAVDIASR